MSLEHCTQNSENRGTYPVYTAQTSLSHEISDKKSKKYIRYVHITN